MNTLADDRPVGPANDQGLDWLLLLLGLLPVMSAAAHHAPWGAEPSLGLLMVLLGGWSLVLRSGRAPERSSHD